MNTESILSDTASLFLALGDRTRLRLLNLMRDREICVTSFTDVLGQSQPLVSRHLAYLRNAGIVEARREGKWMHYRISTQLDDNTHRLLFELFKWMEGQNGLQAEREKCKATKYLNEAPVRRERKPAKVKRPASKRIQAEPVETVEEQYEVYDRTVHHNELEDFLL